MELGRTVVKVLGGREGIGGNMVLIEHGSSRVILDFGVQFSKLRRFYTWPHRMPGSVKELIDLGVAPRVRGFYVDSEEVLVDAALLSHYHLDHCYLLPQISRKIPIYMGETSKIFFNYYKRVKRRESRGIWRPNGLENSIRTFRTGDELRVGEFRVYPMHVDHSIPGAYGFIIESRDAVIVYTGDYRLHGVMRNLTNDFLEKASEWKVDLLITEGTNFFEVTTMSEEHVYNQLLDLIRGVEGAVLASFNSKDVDRFKSYFKVAVETGREILMSYKQLLLLNYLKERDLKLKRSIPELRGYVKAYYKNIRRDVKEELEEKGFELIRVEGKELMDLKGKIITSFTDILQEISLKSIPSGSICVFSESEPVDEEGEVELEKIINWLQHLSIPSYRIHCSGHVYPLELREVVRRIKPKRLEVIHSNYPEALKRFILK